VRLASQAVAIPLGPLGGRWRGREVARCARGSCALWWHARPAAVRKARAVLAVATWRDGVTGHNCFGVATRATDTAACFGLVSCRHGAGAGAAVPAGDGGRQAGGYHQEKGPFGAHRVPPIQSLLDLKIRLRPPFLPHVPWTPLVDYSTCSTNCVIISMKAHLSRSEREHSVACSGRRCEQ
jgi:hypothetical protein